MSLQLKIENLKNDFSKFTNWEDRYKSIIELGKQLKPLEENLKIDDNLVKGCQSQVWLIGEFDQKSGLVNFKADSDAVIVKGLVALLVSLYSGSQPEEILSHPPTFLKELGFDQNLSPSRANGLYAMIKKMQILALAFKYLKDQKGPQ